MGDDNFPDGDDGDDGDVLSDDVVMDLRRALGVINKVKSDQVERELQKILAYNRAVGSTVSRDPSQTPSVTSSSTLSTEYTTEARPSTTFRSTGYTKPETTTTTTRPPLSTLSPEDVK